MRAEGAAGWHGKLPGASDFASRRLDARLVDLWDDWISAGLARLRADDAQGWVEAYLASPIWRFVQGPGFFPAPFHKTQWAGVLMPSVDRVGRYYPLMLTAALDALPQSTDARLQLWTWLEHLEDTAFDALDHDWPIETLEAALFELGLPAQREGGSPSPGWDEAAPDGALAQFFDSAAAGTCVWYSEPADGPSLLLRSTRRDEGIGRLWKG